jgi:signal transduction histidine kinase
VIEELENEDTSEHETLRIMSLFNTYNFESVIYNKINGKVIININNKKDYLTISISDTGIGIKRDYYSKIFEKFYRINPDYEYEGVGIGLYISEKIIQFHNGSIDLISSPDKGTEFNINIKTEKS